MFRFSDSHSLIFAVKSVDHADLAGNFQDVVIFIVSREVLHLIDINLILDIVRARSLKFFLALSLTCVFLVILDQGQLVGSLISE